jgi:hypothetical protein
VKFINHIIKDLLPAGTEVRHAHPLSASGSGRRSRSGGQIVIVSSNWSSSIIDFRKDESGSGLLTGLYLTGRTQRMLILGRYWYWPQRRDVTAGYTQKDGAHGTGAPWLNIEKFSFQAHNPSLGQKSQV